VAEPEYEIKQTIERDVAEHEVFISFCNDDDAALFYEWLESTGMKLFRGWRVKEIAARSTK
jgi:hypothetical protein